MENKSIKSYNDPSRIIQYDTDMDIMHPNREKMVEVALEVLPFDRDLSFTAIELGSGTGYFTKYFLERFPEAKVIAVEGSASMVELSKSRLGEISRRVEFKTGDFRDLASIIKDKPEALIVFSSYALHHLTKVEKLSMLQSLSDLLLPGGWFINCDLIVSEHPEIEKRIQDIRIQCILDRSKGNDSRFKTYSSTRKYLDKLEAAEDDKPLTIKEDLHLLQNAGLYNSTIFWLEYREVVYGAIK